MRISSNQMFNQVSQSILRQEAELSRLVEQLGTGRRILSAGDDPLAASQAVNVSSALSQTGAFASNRVAADHVLKSQENALNAASTTMQSVLERLVYAGNGTLTDTDLRSLATDLQGMRNALIGLANSTDGSGRYIFSGYDSATPPYRMDGEYLVPPSRNKAPEVRVSPQREMKAGVVGSEVFARANPGSTGYVVSAGISNSGSAQAGMLTSSTTSAAVTRTVKFVQVSGGSLEYIYNQNDGTSVSRPYVAGQALDIGDGLTLPISGTPNDQDTFTVTSFGDSDSVDVFRILDKLIGGLKISTENNPQGAAAMANITSEASQTLHNAFDNIQTVLSNLGSKMQEVAALNGVGATETLAYTKQLSDLEDVNVVTAMTEAEQRRTALQAAGVAFQAIRGLNLFQQ